MVGSHLAGGWWLVVGGWWVGGFNKTLDFEGQGSSSCHQD